jgi:hypothetical protein
MLVTIDFNITFTLLKRMLIHHTWATLYLDLSMLKSMVDFKVLPTSGNNFLQQFLILLYSKVHFTVRRLSFITDTISNDS